MSNSQRIPKFFLVVAAATFLATAGCSNKTTEQATNQAPPLVKKAAAKAAAPKPASSKPAAPKPAAKPASSGKVVAAKAPAAKPAAKPASSKVPASKATPANFVTVPQGTTVRATVSDALASNKNHSGDSFAAILSSSIKVDGKTVIPKGAHVSGRVVTAKKSGPAELTVALTSVHVNGKSYTLATEPIDRVGKAPKDAGDTESAKAEKDITVPAQSHLKFKLAKPAKIPAQAQS